MKLDLHTHYYPKTYFDRIRDSGGDGRDKYLPYAYVSAYINDAAYIRDTPERRLPPL